MSMARRLRRLLVLPAVVSLLTTLSWAGGSPAQAATILQAYSVTIQGTASGWSFTRTGTLILVQTVTRATTNGVNPVDVCLISGSPAQFPQTGAISYNSNSACIKSNATLDLAYVSVGNGTVGVQPDQRLSATGGNSFTARNGVTACIYHPVSGVARYTLFANNTVSGAVAITGYGGAFCKSVNYIANISGRRIY